MSGTTVVTGQDEKEVCVTPPPGQRVVQYPLDIFKTGGQAGFCAFLSEAGGCLASGNTVQEVLERMSGLVGEFISDCKRQMVEVPAPAAEDKEAQSDSDYVCTVYLEAAV